MEENNQSKAIPQTISLYNTHISAVKSFAKYNNIRDTSKAYQYIIEDFFTKDDKKIKRDFILYLVVPIIFCIFTTFVNISTSNVYTNLLKNGIYYHELKILSDIFLILSVLSVSILAACIYWLRKIKLAQNTGVEYGNTD